MSNTITTALIVNNAENVNQLVNKDLRVNVSKMLKATAGLNRDTWSYAIAVHNIIENELYKEDFKTVENFSKCMGSTKGTFSKLNKAVLTIMELGEYGYDMKNMSCTTAYMLGCLNDEMAEFMAMYHDTDLGKLTKDQLEDIIKKFKARNDEVIEEAEEVEEAEEKPTGVSVEAQIEKGVLTFTYRKKTYSVPLEALKDYIVK